MSESFWCANCDGPTTLDGHAHCARCGSDALAPALSPPFRAYDGWIEGVSWAYDDEPPHSSTEGSFSPPESSQRATAPLYDDSPTDWPSLPEDDARRGGLPVE